MSVVRWLRHWFKTPYAVRKAYSEQALERIQQAIADSERSHSGEIRFAVEAALPWSYLKRDAPVRQRAEMLFAKLRVWDTDERNGVLIYVELADRGIEIVADRGVARAADRAVWAPVVTRIAERFRAGDFEGGLLGGIDETHRLLARHFPPRADGRDEDELPNRPVIVGR